MPSSSSPRSSNGSLSRAPSRRLDAQQSRRDVLVLFDIDGTLISRSGPQHKQALEYAVWKVLRVRTSLDGIPTHGMLDTDLVLALAKRAGVPRAEVKEAMPALVYAAEARYSRQNPGSLVHRVCPGAKAVLRQLDRRAVPLMLVTGNFPSIGWKKLELAGLHHFFLDGAFAGMRTTRPALARLALQTARRRGWTHTRTCASLVGDSPNDIQAAHANHIRSVAVCTGINTPEELRAHQPHVLVETMRSLTIDDLLAPGC